LLREPLRIAVVTSRSAEGSGHTVESISQALRDSHMYDIIDVKDLRPPASTNPQKEWNQFLERCSKKGIKIVLLSNIDSLEQKIRIDQQPSGDYATEHVVNISLKAYSAKRKTVKAEINLTAG
jgi:hypothetical protein